jgi:predicted Ser/Thr protein kinase
LFILVRFAWVFFMIVSSEKREAEIFKGRTSQVFQGHWPVMRKMVSIRIRPTRQIGMNQKRIRQRKQNN